MEADISLVKTLREIESKDPDMAALWKTIVNQLHKNCMGNNTANEIRIAFDAIGAETSKEL